MFHFTEMIIFLNLGTNAKHFFLLNSEKYFLQILYFWKVLSEIQKFKHYIGKYFLEHVVIYSKIYFFRMFKFLYSRKYFPEATNLNIILKSNF